LELDDEDPVFFTPDVGIQDDEQNTVLSYRFIKGFPPGTGFFREYGFGNGIVSLMVSSCDIKGHPVGDGIAVSEEIHPFGLIAGPQHDITAAESGDRSRINPGDIFCQSAVDTVTLLHVAEYDE